MYRIPKGSVPSIFLFAFVRVKFRQTVMDRPEEHSGQQTSNNFLPATTSGIKQKIFTEEEFKKKRQLVNNIERSKT
jgi:hypothetical protein